MGEDDRPRLTERVVGAGRAAAVHESSKRCTPGAGRPLAAADTRGAVIAGRGTGAGAVTARLHSGFENGARTDRNEGEERSSW